jgi:hypothetical protein
MVDRKIRDSNFEPLFVYPNHMQAHTQTLSFTNTSKALSLSLSLSLCPSLFHSHKLPLSFFRPSDTHTHTNIQKTAFHIDFLK